MHYAVIQHQVPWGLLMREEGSLVSFSELIENCLTVAALG